MMGYLHLTLKEFSNDLRNRYLKDSQRYRTGGVNESKKMNSIPEVLLKCTKYVDILVMKVIHPVNFLTLIYSKF